MSEATNYAGEFKEAVLKHLTRKLPNEEWTRLRVRSGGNVAMTFEEVVDAGYAEQGLTVHENLIPEYKSKASPIDFVAGQPVWYVAGAGFYVWSIHPNHTISLCVWLTHPAYPEKW